MKVCEHPGKFFRCQVNEVLTRKEFPGNSEENDQQISLWFDLSGATWLQCAVWLPGLQSKAWYFPRYTALSLHLDILQRLWSAYYVPTMERGAGIRRWLRQLHVCPRSSQTLTQCGEGVRAPLGVAKKYVWDNNQSIPKWKVAHIPICIQINTYIVSYLCNEKIQNNDNKWQWQQTTHSPVD